MAHEFIYTCYKGARVYPPDPTVLENISLSFYPGAKISVPSANRAGKSRLLRPTTYLDNVAKWILELDRGRGIPFEGNYSSWLEQKQERLAREEKGNEARQRTLQRELEWVRMAPKARQAK